MFDLNVVLVQDSRERIRQILERYEEECKIWNPLAVYSQLHMFLKGTEIFSHSLNVMTELSIEVLKNLGRAVPF